MIASQALTLLLCGPQILVYTIICSNTEVITIFKCIALLLKQLAFWGSSLKQVKKKRTENIMF